MQIGLLLLLTAAVCFGQVELRNWNTSVDMPRYPDEGPLPERAPGSKGKLVFWVDHKSVKDDKIVLYLINGTDEKIVFKAQDGDLYAKLEVRTDPKTWQRAQTHRYSWCGNSYFGVTLKPGHFVRFHGWFPSKGKPTQVRYRIYTKAHHDVVSNDIEGFIPKNGLEGARYDMMSVDFCDYDHLVEIVSGKGDAPLKARYAKQPEDLDWHLTCLRHKAATRMLEMEPEKATVVIIRLMQEQALPVKAHDRIFYDLIRKGRPASAVRKEFLRTLGNPEHPVIRETNFVAGNTMYFKSDEVLDMLLEIAKIADHPKRNGALDRIGDCLNAANLSEFKRSIAAIQDDAPVRKELEQILKDTFPHPTIKFRITGSGPGDRLHQKAELVNVSEKPVEFSYSSIREIVSVEIVPNKPRKKDEMRPPPPALRPREGVEFFVPVEGKRTQVRLNPGERLTFDLPLDEFFAIPPGRYHMRYHCFIPGVMKAKAAFSGRQYENQVQGVVVREPGSKQQLIWMATHAPWARLVLEGR